MLMLCYDVAVFFFFFCGVGKHVTEVDGYLHFRSQNR